MNVLGGLHLSDSITLKSQTVCSQDPKRGIASTKVVLQPSTTQPGPQTRQTLNPNSSSLNRKPETLNPKP